MIEGIGEAVVDASPEQVLGFVLDLDSYRQADFKIGAVAWIRPDATGATIKFRGVMNGRPGPYVTQRVDRSVVGDTHRLDVRSVAPAWMNAIVRFEGVFEATPVDGGTKVYHREALYFRPPFSWLIEPRLRAWLAADTPAEVSRFAELVHGHHG
jgi:Polyketide cyclase / dehydrase and lipid transport